MLALAVPAQATAAEAGQPGADGRAPTTPAGLTAYGVTGTSANLTWRPATDNVGVAAYDVYLGRTLVRSVTGTTATVADLVPGAAYTFAVRARDGAGNASAASNRVTVTAGRVRPANFAVFGFSQSDVEQEDPQIYTLAPDINIRAIGKWSTNGDEAADYNFAQIARYHDKGITFMGSGTASVIFPHDFATTEIFDDMSTRDADNAPVPHDEFGFPVPARRGNMFNPRYRQHLLDWAKIQIDGGVDGLNFDEVNAGFSGGQKYGFNGNEGFDDYAIADFNRYLLAKYPAFTAGDWKSRFGMTDDNVVRADVPAGDLSRNFNYREYLRANGWNGAPLTAANPLAVEWGRVTANRMYAEDMSFTGTYLRRYWKGMVDEVRAYARRTADREILVTSNGLIPYVDFNSVGMYPWNPDEQTPDFRGADYVPVVDGHLHGAKSLQANYRYLKDKSSQISGNVPVTVFIDWPNDMMTNYLNLPLAERQDYWRIFGAEAYANGIFPAFHLKDTVGSPTAEQLGMLDFLRTYSRFYSDHRSLYHDNDHGTAAVRVSAANVAASLLMQRGSGARTLHLVNHNYDRAIVPQAGLRVTVDVPSCPRRVAMVSPDFPGSKAPAFSCRNGTLTVTVDRLDYYNVLVLR
ncbi:MAG TPA: fibronectin type III domain-containing protein [Pilimelia sp.]|nr:fibronectin type III domain-containing protein [Pilimelia sp.]